MKLKDQYTKEIFSQFGYHATWLPHVNFELGDIGIIEDNRFTRISSLEELGINISAREDRSTASLDYSSQNGVSIKAKASGSPKLPNSTLDVAESGFLIDFSREKSILFQLSGMKNTSILDTIELGEEVLEKYNKNTWKKEWVVITELVTAKTATIVISNSASGKLELNSKGLLNPTITDLSKLKAELSIVAQRDLEVNMICAKNTTPLFKLMGIKGWLKPDFRSKSMSESGFLNTVLEENLSFEEITPELKED